MENVEKSVTLRFSLTRLQRVVNPITGLALALTGVAGFVVILVAGGMGLFAFTVTTASQEGVWAATWKPLFTAAAATAVCFVMWRLLFWRPIRNTYSTLFSDYYVNTVVIGDRGRVLFGVDGVQREMAVGKAISKGLFGTYVISCGPCSVVVPDGSIEFDDLRRRVECWRATGPNKVP